MKPTWEDFDPAVIGPGEGVSIAAAPPDEPSPKLRYADSQVAINLTDPTFRGVYHGKRAHEDDLEDVLKRALDVGCTKLMVTGSSLKESQKAVALAQQHPGLCYATIGVHPCSTAEFDEGAAGPDAMLRDLERLASDAHASGAAVAFGEIGLDYDRLSLASKPLQLKYFEKQLEAAVRLQLPLFLHSRAASEDFERLLGPKLAQIPKRGLVHSFTGTLDEMQRMLDLGLDVGVNGCSMKTEENVAVVKAIPLDRMQIETDGPWCEIRASHASASYVNDPGAPPLVKAVKKEKFERGLMVKGRNEPAMIVRVAQAVARIKDVPVQQVAEATWRNSVQMFGLGETVVEEAA
ncbi:MAG: hypothetical protein M1838_004428 [Thelocarpon superellum]|nr:MAG: hypothetical protein M1838_004428 [Thelocarpon superellum]